jgi:hypothetical protein
LFIFMLAAVAAVGTTFAAVFTRWFGLGIAGAAEHTAHILGVVYCSA